MSATATMDEFEAMLNESLERETPKEGTVVKGKVIAVENGQAIIDVGFKTTDYMVADGAHYSERGSSTSDHGISRAFTSISNSLQQNTGVVPELYRLYDAVDRGYIKIRGRQIDLQQLTQQAYTQLAKVIATEANRLWNDDWDIDQWPDPNDYDPSELYAIPGQTTQSGDQAYLPRTTPEIAEATASAW